MMASVTNAVDNLGPIGIIREAFKIFRTYSKVFLLIQLTLMLGVVTLSTVGQYFLFVSYNVPPQGPVHGSHSWIAAALRGHSPIIDIVTLWLFSVVFGLVYNFFMSLSHSATLHSVALHYGGQAVSFPDVIRASVPRLWMRLAVTSSYWLLIGTVIVFVQSVCPVFLPLILPRVWALVLTEVIVLLVLPLSVGINAIFSVALAVSVFEDNYGWAAVSKGLKLLKGKVKVAIFLQMLVFLPSIIQALLQFGFLYETRQADYGGWNILIRTLTGAAYIIWSSFAVQLLILCYGVQYASFNAHRNSVVVTDSIRAETVGYERVGSGANEPLLGGQDKDSKV